MSMSTETKVAVVKSNGVVYRRIVGTEEEIEKQAGPIVAELRAQGLPNVGVTYLKPIRG